ncbi:unnamed protein product [Acanthoscelides obtectus]|uniref:PiggyBac transposable element-derived protein domain-containing protein n=1 Tax=Acanthoscelides obtectus TaxID=200917 RepID=A0A9P0K2S2_ACAOB|nr:unnamed protein product [Acanthoscelides obtectus]CAK1627496.1 PiggyBac transposable element-derived protein 3 [Acanthoscelides obtectus]
MAFNENTRPLTAAELQELADNMDLNDSDIDDNIDIGESGEEQEEFFQQPDVTPQDDNFDTSDEEPLINIVKRISDRCRYRHKEEFYPSVVREFVQEEINRSVKEPMQYFCKYLDDDFFENIAHFSNIREVKTTGKSLGTSSAEIKRFFGCSMLMGIYNLPRIKMYWGVQTRVPIISEKMSRNRFFVLRSRLKLVDDDMVSKEARDLDRFWKVKPMLEKIQRGCRSNIRTENVSIDEQMIPFHGQVKMRQFVRGKPNPVGLKAFVMTTPQGIPLDILMYEGKGTSVDSILVDTPEKLNVGGRYVLKLADTLPKGVSVFTDRFFTSIPLVDCMLSRSLTVTGTLMSNRVPKEAKFESDSILKKRGRGSSDQLVRQDEKMVLVKWFDSRPVQMASSKCGSEPLGECKRWSKSDNKYIQIPQPNVIKEYNAFMGGVDLLDRVIGKYCMRSRTKKWTIRFIYHFFDFAAAASWLEYREDASLARLEKKQIMDYMDFKFAIAQALLYNLEDKENETSEDEEAVEIKKPMLVEALPARGFRRESALHLPEFMNDKQKSRSKCRLAGCKMLTFTRCTACNVFLCCSVNRNCFLLFHK